MGQHTRRQVVIQSTKIPQGKRVWGQKTQRAESLPDVGRDSLGSELEPLRRDL